MSQLGELLRLFSRGLDGTPDASVAAPHELGFSPVAWSQIEIYGERSMEAKRSTKPEAGSVTVELGPVIRFEPKMVCQ